MRHLDTPWIISKVYRWTSFQLQTGNCQWPTGHVQTQQHVRIRRVYNECIYIYTYTHTHVNVRFKPSIIIHHLQSIHHISINIHQIRSHPSSMTRTDHLGHGARHGLGLARQAPCGVLPGAGREICCGFQRFRWIPSASFKGLLWCMDFYGFLWVSIGILCISMIHDFFQGWIYCFFRPGWCCFPHGAVMSSQLTAIPKACAVQVENRNLNITWQACQCAPPPNQTPTDVISKIQQHTYSFDSENMNICSQKDPGLQKIRSTDPLGSCSHVSTRGQDV